MDERKARAIAEPKPDLTTPIARKGESIYASIHRRRSGIDAGCIDMGVRSFEIEKLCDADKQDICNTALAVYETICNHAGMKSAHDKLKEMVEGSEKQQMIVEGKMIVHAIVPLAEYVELTPEEIEGDEPHSLENPKESVQRD